MWCIMHGIFVDRKEPATHNFQLRFSVRLLKLGGSYFTVTVKPHCNHQSLLPYQNRHVWLTWK